MAKEGETGTLIVVLLFVGLQVVIGFTDQGSKGHVNVDPMMPVFMKFNFWNVENPDEVKQGGLPFLTEKGPYVYQETRDKHDISYQNDSEFVSYGLYKQWDYVEDLSCVGCSKDDQVTILNMPLLGVVYVAHQMGAFMEGIVLSNVNKALNGEAVGGFHGCCDPTATNNVTGCCTDTLFVTKGVDDLLFGGIDDGLVEFLMDYSLTEGSLPPQIKKETGFAIMNPKNSTSDNEWYLVDTGKVDLNRHSMIAKWGPKKGDLREDLESTRWWPVRGYKGRDSCMKIEGTDGLSFAPFINKEKKWSFQTDVCRSMSYVYEKEVDIDGIKAYRFTTSAESQWVNRTDNFCFNDELGDLYDKETETYDACIKEMEDQEVLDIKDCHIKMDGRDGLLDLHHCLESPLIVSNPHFYQAEQELVNIASGMNPDPKLHGVQIDVEPNTGITIQLHKRVQFNMPLMINEHIDALNMVPEMMFPVLWIDEGGRIDDENKKILQDKLDI